MNGETTAYRAVPVVTRSFATGYYEWQATHLGRSMEERFRREREFYWRAKVALNLHR